MAASLQGSLSKDQGAHLLPAITAKTAKVNETSKDGLANKAAVYGILCWTCLLGFVTAIPAVIYGHKALIQAKAHPAKKGLRRAWLGILSGYAFMAFLVSCLIANLLDPTQWIDAINAKSSSKFSVGLLGPTGKVVDGVAITEKTAVYQSSPSLLGYEAAQAIYEIAKERPDVKSVKVIFYMNPSGVEDKYGKSVKAPLLMGEINELQLDEVRRYRDAEAFAYHAKMRYAALISRMDHAHLFK